MYRDFLFLIVIAYLAGSVPFGKFAGWFYGIDIQKQGSGNIGFANVCRQLGWRPGVLVLLGDILKGYLPVLAATHYLSVHQIMVVGLAALVGHIFPVWLKFRGGKGIATGLGITLAISPWLGLVGAGVYIVGFAVFRKSAAASLLATGCVMLGAIFLAKNYDWYYGFLLVVALLTHRDNIKQMLGKAKK